MLKKLSILMSSTCLMVMILLAPRLALSKNDFSPRYNPALATFCDSVSEIPAAECNALVDLYTSTNGANWTNHTNWLVTTTPCDWYGIICDTGHVVHLYLGANNLAGTLPISLGSLSSLLDIFFFGNNLSGIIPDVFAPMSSLQILNAGYNNFSGSIPASLGNALALTEIQLNNNQLTGAIPGSLGSLVNLQNLNLGYNHLTNTIPASLGNLLNLTQLGLHVNNLVGPIPSSLGNLTKLVGFGLSSNNFNSDLPLSFSGLINLQVLDMQSTNLTGPLPDLSGMTKLTRLNMAFNHINGGLPDWFGNLVSLQDLFAAHNQLSGSIPSGFGSLTQLRTFDVADNQLQGDIPASLASLTNVQTLSIEFNMLTASDANLIPWLNTKQPNWNTSQTIPPTNLQTVTLPNHSIRVSWTPILYTNHNGYYEVSYSNAANGPFTNSGCSTANKVSISCDVPNLASNTNYYFAVRTYTAAHADSFQENNLLSIFSSSALGISAPANDDFADAVSINAGAPSAFTQDVAHATMEAIEPIATCGGATTFYSVWYKYVALANNTLNINTTGSNYDTILSVWKGAGLDALTPVGCNDNNAALTTSGLSLATTTGVTYYIRVSSKVTFPTNLVFHASSVSTVGAAPSINYLSTASPTLTWNALTNVTQYTIEVSTSSTFASLVFPSIIVPADQLSVTTNPLPEGIYYWRVSANNGATWSIPGSFAIDLP